MPAPPAAETMVLREILLFTNSLNFSCGESGPVLVARSGNTMDFFANILTKDALPCIGLPMPGFFCSCALVDGASGVALAGVDCCDAQPTLNRQNVNVIRTICRSARAGHSRAIVCMS